MSLVILIEQNHGRLGWYKPSPQQYEVTGETEVEFLTRLESEYTAQGAIIRGIIDELAIPDPPLGGTISDLIWDDENEEPSYGTKYICEVKKAECAEKIAKTNFDWITAMKKGDAVLAQEIADYSKALEDLSVVIDIDPYNFNYPVNPVKTNGG